VPDGSPEDEVGLFHNVVANPPTYGVSGGTALEFGTSPKLAESHAATASMPDGYDSDVSSTATLDASESLLFSVPLNHLSGKWHIEIPFRFDVPHKRPLHYEANIGANRTWRLVIGFRICHQTPGSKSKQRSSSEKSPTMSCRHGYARFLLNTPPDAMPKTPEEILEQRTHL
jgi:hypothetical protein